MLEQVGIFTDFIVGFSIFAAVLLLLAYQFLLRSLTRTTQGRIACALLLLSLTVIQLYHFDVVNRRGSLFDELGYVVSLLLAPPSFYLFSNAVLLPEQRANPWKWLHYLPFTFAFFLPSSILVPVAFGLGALYSVWFAQFVYGMRRHVARYRFEQFFFVFFAVMAVVAFVLILSIPIIDERIFYLVYANFTGLSLWLITGTLIVFPEAVEDMSSAARLAYAKSTLENIDTHVCLERLEALMKTERCYENEALNLGTLAKELDIGSHQLSELINTHFGVNFSRYIREQRVTAAKALLAEDRQASVLSVGLSVGFRSQSNFYAAFQEITGQTPGAYRRSLGS